MKKKILLFALVAIMAFSAISVSAKDFYPKNDSYTITYNVGAENATAQYGMIVVKGTGDNVDMNEILYVGQAAADENGNIAFTNFAPMGEAPSNYEGCEGDDGEGPYFEECTVYIGGAGIGDTALELGVLKNASGFPVSGTVVDTFAPGKPATVEIYAGDAVEGDDPIGSAITEEDGTFAITIGGGENLSVVFKKAGYLTFTYTGVSPSGALDLGEVPMSGLAGDVDGSGKVENADLRKLLTDFFKTTGNMADANSDLDASGKVENADLRQLLKVFFQTNKTQAYKAK